MFNFSSYLMMTLVQAHSPLTVTLFDIDKYAAI